jgi:hypothetical protein
MTVLMMVTPKSTRVSAHAICYPANTGTGLDGCEAAGLRFVFGLPVMGPRKRALPARKPAGIRDSNKINAALHAAG